MLTTLCVSWFVESNTGVIVGVVVGVLLLAIVLLLAVLYGRKRFRRRKLAEAQKQQSGTDWTRTICYAICIMDIIEKDIKYLLCYLH